MIYTLALSLLRRFWLHILIIAIVTGSMIAVKRWDNNRLEAVFLAGQKSVEEFYANEERRIMEEADAIFERNVGELFDDLDKLSKHNISLQKQINDFNKKPESKFSCSPTPEYLSLWDDATSGEGAAFTSGELGQHNDEVPSSPGS